jgi:flavin reductase ActVB
MNSPVTGPGDPGPPRTEARAIDHSAFSRALSKWAAGVTIVTTVTEKGQRWGFTASAFSSLSLDPPLVLVCLDSGADCHTVFDRTHHFAVNILRPTHEALALLFASKGADKFAGGRFTVGESGVPILPDALASIECRVERRLPGGDHTILIGTVLFSHIEEGRPLVYYGRAFHEIAPRRRPSQEGDPDAKGLPKPLLDGPDILKVLEAVY